MASNFGSKFEFAIILLPVVVIEEILEEFTQRREGRAAIQGLTTPTMTTRSRAPRAGAVYRFGCSLRSTHLILFDLQLQPVIAHFTYLASRDCPH